MKSRIESNDDNVYENNLLLDLEKLYNFSIFFNLRIMPIFNF